MLLQERTGICGEERAPLCGRAATMERSAQQQGRFRSRLGSKALAVRVGVVALALVAAGCTNSSPTATGTTPGQRRHSDPSRTASNTPNYMPIVRGTIRPTDASHVSPPSGPAQAATKPAITRLIGKETQ